MANALPHAPEQTAPPLGTTLALKQALHVQYPQARAETIDAALALLERAGAALPQALTARLVHAVSGLATTADQEDATTALGQTSDYTLLLKVLSSPAVLEQARMEDPLGPARLRWLRDRERLLTAEGGVLPVTDVMRLLGLKSRQAVHRRRSRGTLLGLPLGGLTYVYPVWQFDQQGKILSGLPETLAALALLDAWGQAAYLLAGEPRLDDARPLDALRSGRREQVVQAARHYGEQGGS